MARWPPDGQRRTLQPASDDLRAPDPSLGSVVKVTDIATGRNVSLEVNDRGPYVHKFVIDLSRSAARALGVDIAEDRSVLIRIIALPGEQPLPDDILAGPETITAEETAAK